MAKIAIIETGGKQYVVTDGSVLKVEKIKGTGGASAPSSHEATEGHSKAMVLKAGDTISFDKVLLTDDGSKVAVGKPYLAGVTVSAELIEEGRNPTITVIRYREKSRSFKKNGHRQPHMKVRITAIP